jgi:hypothetical protein
VIGNKLAEQGEQNLLYGVHVDLLFQMLFLAGAKDLSTILLRW